MASIKEKDAPRALRSTRSFGFSETEALTCASNDWLLSRSSECVLSRVERK
jgi:hypothetical protein